MYSNSLLRHFSSMVHAKCLLPNMDRLLLVRSCLQNFYQCGRPPTAKKEGTGRNKKRRGRVCKLDTGSPCTLKILLLVANLFTAHTQKKTNLCSRNLQRCDRRSQVVTPFGNLRCVCMQYIFKNQKTDKLNLLSLGCKFQFCSSTRLKVNLKLLANTGSATRN